MARVAVITAPNPGYDNPGMLTVDLAFDAFARRTEPAFGISWFTLVPPDREPIRRGVDPARLPFRHRPLADHLDEVYDHDAIVYWGDFLHARSYLEKDAARHVRKYALASDEEEGRRLLDACYLLRDAPDEVLDRTFLFGGTVLPDPEPDEQAYGRAFRRLVGGARGVWMREPVSAARAARIRGTDPEDCLGVDPAFLPGRDDPRERPPAGATVGVFAGVRTPIPRGFVAYCRALADRLDARVEWLPWLRFRRLKPNRWRRHVARLSLGGTGRRVPFRDLVDGLARHRVVVTDTYHLCVNAWRRGTPVVCLGRENTSTKGALGDRKKRVLHEMFGASEFYQPVGDDPLPSPDAAAARVEGGAGTPVVGRIREAAARAEARLRAALRPLLQASTK